MTPGLHVAARHGWIVWSFFWVFLNAAIAATTLPLLTEPQDWWIFEALPAKLAAGALHEPSPGYTWAYSVITAWIVIVLILPLGYQIWFWSHAAVLVLLKDWRLVIAGLLSVPLWMDASLGNAFAFVAVSAVIALRRGLFGKLVYLALFVLMPRPVQLPLAAWLLWREPAVRLPFLGFVVVVVLAATSVGGVGAWAAAIIPLAGGLDYPGNLGPTRVIGLWWMLIGIPVSALLTLRGKVGWAGLAISPYLTPTYFLILLAEMPSSRTGDR